MHQSDLLTKFVLSPKLFTLLVAVLFTFSSKAQLIINEIMFNDGSTNEYVELYNNSGAGVSLTGWTLEVDGNSRSLSGTIPANGYLIVYHTSSPNAGSYFTYLQLQGYSFLEIISNTLPANLDNTSSVLTLKNGGTTEDAVTYLNTWAGSGASGTGRSLELNSASDDNSLEASWSTSVFDDGSYGGQNTAISCYTSTCNSAFSNLSSSVDLIQVSGTQTIQQDLTMDQLIVKSGATLNLDPTGNTGHHFSLTGVIDNDGTFSIGNNCTVLQTSTSVNNGGGTYKFERLGDNDAGMHNIWGAPVSNASVLTTFNSANPCDIYTYNSSNQAWKYDYSLPFATTCNGNSTSFNSGHMVTDAGSSADGVMDIGRGYFAPGSNTLTLRTFSGSELNNGTITEPIVINGTGASGNDDWNLISNPYPSGIDAEQFTNTNTNIQAALYFWNPSSSGGGTDSDYKVWTSLGSIGNTLNGGEITATLSGSHIAASQGFFVEANSSGNVTFNNSMRSNTSNQFFKTGNTMEDGIDRIWVSFTSEQKNFSRQVLIGFTDDATDGKDRKYEATTIEGNQNMAFYTILGEEHMSIQGLPKLQENDTKIIPLGFNSTYQGVHSIKIDTTINWNDNVEVFVKDELKESLVSLKNGEYFFYSGTGRDDNRFSLVFKYSTVTSVENIENATNYVKTMYLDGQWMINSSLENITEYQVIDMAGKLLKNNKLNQRNITIDTHSFTSGLYFVKVKFANKQEKILKFVAQ